LLLPVSTASVERTFSTMNIIKRKLRNKIEDDWMNDLMVCYTEKWIFKSLDDETITLMISAYQKKKNGIASAHKNKINSLVVYLLLFSKLFFLSTSNLYDAYLI
jgi:ribosome-associated toxin RatA of RatAB toxin-antitoxin module